MAMVVLSSALGCGDGDVERVAVLDSAVATGAYTITPAPLPVSAPVFTPVPGYYPSAMKVTITCPTTGATIYYTTNGAAPTTASTVYSAPITISASTTVNVIAAKTGMITSNVVSGSYVLYTLPRVATPTITPNGATFSSTVAVTITCATPGAVIRYTLDGTATTEKSPIYSAPIRLTATTTVRVKGYKSGMIESVEATASFTRK